MANSLLPQRLKELRKVNNYTQDYVAEALGTTRITTSIPKRRYGRKEIYPGETESRFIWC